MTPDQAREKAWQEWLKRQRRYVQLHKAEYKTGFTAGFDAALAYVWEECGVPRRPAVYLRWYAREWVPTWVYEMTTAGKPSLFFDDEDEAPWAVETVRHWRRLRLPPPPEGE